MDEEYEEGKGSKGGSLLAVLAIIIAVIALFGLAILYLIYFFRRPNNQQNYIVRTIVNVAPDSSVDGTATITPIPEYVYVLTSAVTAVVLNTPTVSNYGGTTFTIKAPLTDTSRTITVTPPPNVSLQTVLIPPGYAATFLWSNDMTILYVI